MLNSADIDTNDDDNGTVLFLFHNLLNVQFAGRGTHNKLSQQKLICAFYKLFLNILFL